MFSKAQFVKKANLFGVDKVRIPRNKVHLVASSPLPLNGWAGGHGPSERSISDREIPALTQFNMDLTDEAVYELMADFERDFGVHLPFDDASRLLILYDEICMLFEKHLPAEDQGRHDLLSDFHALRG